MIQASLFPDPGGEVRAGTPPRRGGLRFAVLGSGSAGNAVVVESAGRRILVDAGFSAREIGRRLALLGLVPEDLEAVVLTHEHQDHVRGAAGLARRFRLPIFATAGTLRHARLPRAVEPLLSEIPCDARLEVAGLELEPFLVPHDAREPIGLVVEDAGGCRLGLAADLGCRSRLVWARLSGVHALLLETNHDLDMLRNGPYPWPLKQRVGGRHGHLSNGDAAEGLPELLHDHLQWLVCYHLSRTNNLPALAAAVVGETLDREGSGARVVVSSQFEGTGWMEVGDTQLPPRV